MEINTFVMVTCVILLIIMKIYSKKEECDIDIGQFCKKIIDWDIKARIYEKIEVWKLKLNQAKIKLIPIRFASLVMTYFLINNYKEFISNYDPSIQINNLYELKDLYNILSIDKLKKANIFQYSILIIIKVYHYFITYHYPHLINQRKIIQQQLYKSIIAVLIGYEVDSNAYEVLLNRYGTLSEKEKENQSPRNSNNILRCQSLEASIDDPFVYAFSSKKIHRKGFLNYSFEGKQQVGLQSFLTDIQKALYLQKKLLNTKKQLIKTKKLEQGKSQQFKGFDKMPWKKGRNKILKTNQISSSMSIHKGFQLNYKPLPQMHLSPRRAIPQFEKTSAKKKTTFNDSLSQIRDNTKTPKQKNWNQIIQKMKTEHSPDTPMKSHDVKQMNTTKILMSLSKRKQLPLNSQHKKMNNFEEDNIKKEEFYYLTSVKTSYADYIQYPHRFQNNNCNQNHKHIRHNSNSNMYFKEKNSFLKDCQNRKTKVYDALAYFPSIKKN